MGEPRKKINYRSSGSAQSDATGERGRQSRLKSRILGKAASGRSQAPKGGVNVQTTSTGRNSTFRRRQAAIQTTSSIREFRRRHRSQHSIGRTARKPVSPQTSRESVAKQLIGHFHHKAKISKLENRVGQDSQTRPHIRAIN